MTHMAPAHRPLIGSQFKQRIKRGGVVAVLRASTGAVPPNFGHGVCLIRRLRGG